MLIALLAIGLATPPRFGGSFMSDFRSFYCAGAAIAAGGDPYRTEPLRSCERRLGPRLTRVAVPSPLPGYALVPFVVLSRAHCDLARAIWLVVLGVSIAVAIPSLARLTGYSATGALALLAVSAGFSSILLGQLAPIAIAGLVIAARALEQQRYGLAASAVGAVTVEPHLAAPVIIAAFIGAPRIRPYLFGICAAIVLVSVEATGYERNVEYFSLVLPAHVASEVANQEQLSLTHLLYLMGVQPAIAIRLGDVSFVVTSAIGVMLGLRLATRRAAFLVLAPAALCLIGGPYIHVRQMIFAIPLALLLSREQPGRAAGIAAALLAVPWSDFARVFFALPILGGSVYICAREIIGL